MKGIERVSVFVSKALNFMVAVTFIILIAACILQVFTRYVLNDSLSWTEELARYAFIWSNLLGAALCTRNGSHATVTAVTDLLPEAALSVSIPKMFLAGIIPGLTLMILLIGVNGVIAAKNPKIIQYKGERFSLKELLKNTWSALGALLLPVIILGGIYRGVLIMSVTQVSTQIVGDLSVFITNKYTYLLVLMVLLFVVGALMDTVAAIIIIAPVIVPLGISLGLDPLHLGMIFVINLVIGYVTPPFGYNLFTACSVTGLKFNDIVKGVWPFLLIEMAAVMIFAYVPILITWLPGVWG